MKTQLPRTHRLPQKKTIVRFCRNKHVPLHGFQSAGKNFALVKKSFSIVLAFLLLFANIGLAKSSHICMGTEMLNAISLSAKNLDCGMKHQKSSSFEKGGLSVANACCQNIFELVHNDSDQQLKDIKTGSVQLIFIAALTHFFILGIDSIDTKNHTSPFLPPPSIEKNYIVLLQTFLI